MTLTELAAGLAVFATAVISAGAMVLVMVMKFSTVLVW